MASRVRIGELLVDAGLLTQEQLARALEEQRLQGGGGKRLGQLVVSLGFVSEGQFIRFLSQQLAVPWVSLTHIDFSPALLALVDRELAERYTVIPVYMRRERREIETLFLAMDDPTQDDVLRIVSERTRHPVRPVIAPPSDIRAAIARAYGVSTDFDDDPPSAAFPMPLVKKPSVQDLFAQKGPRPQLPESVPPPPPERSSSKPPPTPSSDRIARAAPPTPPPRKSEPGRPAVQPSAAQRTPTTPLPEASVPSKPSAQSAQSEPPPAELEFVTDSGPDDEPVHELKSPVHAPVANAPDTRGAAPDVRGEPPQPRETPQPEEPPRASSPPVEPAAAAPARKTIALTLLDGTTIQIPAGTHRARTRRAADATEPAPAPDAAPQKAPPAAVSLLEGLRAATHGLSPEARAQRWEGVVAALLTVLIAKGTVTEAELAAALQTQPT